MTEKKEHTGVNTVNLSTREEIEQFADYLKGYIDRGVTVSFSETFEHSKVREPEDGLQVVGMGTCIEEDRVDNVFEYLVISLTSSPNGEKSNLMKDLSESQDESFDEEEGL